VDKRGVRMRIMEMNLYFIPLLLFILSILGIILNQSNIILILICIEIMLLSLSLNFLIHSFIIDNSLGQLCSIYIITVAAVESAIGLSIIISFYKLKGSVSIRFLNLLKG
jgi:NADH:ubiquinone oxidoreductase subunit K